MTRHIPERPARWRHVARLTIELTSPLLIGTGRGTTFADNTVVCDANDLPALPGTSLAGVLRAAWLTRHPDSDADALFGYQEGEEGMRSRLLVSWGAIHTRTDVAVSSRMSLGDIENDPVLLDARALMLRDHVRIGHRGVVDGRGKFDRSAVRAGHRFTFELELECHSEAQHDSDLLVGMVDLLADPAVRLGAATRAGLGAFRVVRAMCGRFDLYKDAAEYASLAVELSDPEPRLAPVEWQTAARVGDVVRLELEPVEPWVIGGGDPEAWIPDGPRDRVTPPDLLPYREARIEWSPDGGGRVGTPQFCVPATAIKGALRHRTAFWLRAASEQWNDREPGGVPGHGDFDSYGPQALAPIRELFGHVHDTVVGVGAATDDSESGVPGRVFVSDAWPKDVRRRTSTHVSIDRFTGEPMRGHLFEDEALEGGTLEVELVVLPPRKKSDDPDTDTAARDALQRAVDDLCEERLQIGAGFGRGYGWFRAKNQRGGTR